ncbi:MFS transporter [Novosphingobium sp. TH158]|uniref:MFS transporter n=1 Tax=Novosphingobium sp. TH158 TaxID=2067455 RepID=UPI000C7A3EE4|nr:MFS transporter [Novosphingobium sp. TH158]PLK26158.1 MFS transporter [Novosphingobium sp. TH158]
MRTYLGEFRVNWHVLLACSLGLALGSPLSHYTLSLFGPALIAEFGWSKADFALIASVPLLTLPLIPAAGRFVDRFGPRIAASVGFAALPIGFFAFTQMSGNLIEFFAIYLIQHVFGILTTTMVFCRVVVERFDAARGLALSLLMTGPPTIGAIAAKLVGDLIALEGWRAGYMAMAAAAVIGGLMSVPFLRKHTVRTQEDREAVRLPLRDFFHLLRNPVLLLIIGGMVLVNLPQAFASSQLVLIATENGVSNAGAVWMVSLYPIGVIVGRFLSGLALDRMPPHYVAIAALGLPAIGYALFASHVTSYEILAIGVALIGLAQGAEGDIGAYLVSRRFSLKNYSLLLSMVTASIGLGAALGGLVVSASLRMTGRYDAFLAIAAATTLIGAFLIFATSLRRFDHIGEGENR